ncbi:MAG: hypothetical protein NZ932_04225 [Candidatus Bathyarchaeota archaeon]|nr:hypothetical protein [Candidatus Bathyarchaeota archaeon]MDW8040462.1 hypothetical protein [Nitrososphaerota archaeon]
MKTKILASLILAITALSLIGYSYACWNGGFRIDCYSKCDLIFTKTVAWDNEIEKDVATVTARITYDKDTIKIVIKNAYPSYTAHINYTIKNVGNRPAQFTSVTILNPNPEALQITTTDHTGTVLGPCQTIKGTTKVHILQPARQKWQYEFEIRISAKCKPYAYPRTIGFWKNQFAPYLGKPGKPQIGAETLEGYLNQISSQSQVFEFTGNRRQKFTQAYDILEMPKRPTMLDKLKAQLLALWLNQVAGYAEGYTYKGMTAQQIIQGSENAILNGWTKQYEYWKNMCEGFNNLGG